MFELHARAMVEPRKVFSACMLKMLELVLYPKVLILELPMVRGYVTIRVDITVELDG